LNSFADHPELLDDETAALPEDYSAINAAHEMFIRSCLMGMDFAAAGKKRGRDFADPLLLPEMPVEALSFEEAIKFLQTQIPLTRQEYYALDDKLRLRAFTVGRLNDCDAINQVKGIIRRNLESGGSITDFYKMTDDEILNGAGFGKGNMSYWETVYRTNEDAIHNAGRAMGFEADPPIALELVGVNDLRQTEICRTLTDPPFIRPYGDPVWKTLWPPFHFSCRTYVRGIYDQAELDELGGASKVYAQGNYAAPAKGFGGYPLDKESYWRLTAEMVKRAKEYGIDGEIAAAAEKLGLADYWKNIFGNEAPMQKMAEASLEVFQETKTIKEANAYARNVLGITHADYSGCDIVTANEWNRGVYNAIQKFPELKDGLHFIGETRAQNALIKEILEKNYYNLAIKTMPEDAALKWAESKALSDIKKYCSIEAGNMARSTRKGGILDSVAGVSINRDFGRNHETFIKALEKDVRSKFHPEGGNTIKYVLDHELGHQLDELLKIFEDTIIKDLYVRKNHQELTDGLSRYSWDNRNQRPIREFIAEGWAEYQNNPEPRPIAKIIGETIERRYVEWKKKNL
jgi:hypothetical protein